MTQENEQLLLQDLSAKLPYGVKAEHPYAKEALVLGIIERKGYKCGIRYIDVITDKQTYPIRYIKPYLRPMSSMTEEEQKEFVKFHCINICPIVITEKLTISNEAEMFDWLNKKMFDYRGLIPKGLAISTDIFNPYKD